MPPTKEALSASDGKWSLYVDKEDSFSPPPERRPKAQTKARSHAKSKPSVPLTADKEDSSSPPPPQRRPKAKSKAGSKVNPKSSSTHLQKTDADSEKNASDADTPQDGRGNPNLSGITLPLPISLVEPQLLSHNTGFYVITAGIEVGITTVKGIADSRLVCHGPSSETFSTWRQAQSYYNTPVQSPVRKKQKVRAKPLEHESLSQPPFAPAFNTPKVKGSPSQPINVSSTKSTPESQSTRSYMPLYFPESPPVPSKLANSQKRPHAGAQAIPKTHNAGSRTGEYPASAGVQAIPHLIPNIPNSGARQYPEQAQSSPAPLPPYPSCSLSHIDPRYVFVESSSDDGDMTHSNANNAAAATRPYVSVESSSDDGDATDSNINNATAATCPGPSSSLIVEAHSDAPTRYCTSSPIIVISNSEEESEIAWPPFIPRLDADAIHELHMLIPTGNQQQHPRDYRRF